MYSNKIIIYTANTGGKDKPHKVFPKYNNAKYYLFSDYSEQINGWDYITRPFDFTSLTRPHRRIAKGPKIIPWMYLGNNWDYAIWMDATHMVVEDPVLIINKYFTDHKVLCTFDHGRKVKNKEDHNCIYKEAKLVNDIGFLEDKKIVNEQMEFYKSQGMPKDFGLTNNSVIIWKNCTLARKISMAWWEQICRFSSRDQLSLFYVHWKLGTRENHGILPGYWGNNTLINKLSGHKKVEL